MWIPNVHVWMLSSMYVFPSCVYLVSSYVFLSQHFNFSLEMFAICFCNAESTATSCLFPKDWGGDVIKTHRRRRLPHLHLTQSLATFLHPTPQVLKGWGLPLLQNLIARRYVSQLVRLGGILLNKCLSFSPQTEVRWLWYILYSCNRYYFLTIILRSCR